MHRRGGPQARLEARQAEEAAEADREAEREANGGVLFHLVRVAIPFSLPRTTVPRRAQPHARENRPCRAAQRARVAARGALTARACAS
jgi:hypothetical protein